MQISFVALNIIKLKQLHITYFQNVTFGLLSLAVTDYARGCYGTVQRVSGKAKVFQMKEYC